MTTIKPRQVSAVVWPISSDASASTAPPPLSFEAPSGVFEPLPASPPPPEPAPFPVLWGDLMRTTQISLHGLSPFVHVRLTTADDLDFVVAAEQNRENRRFVNQWSRERHRVSLADENILHLIIESAHKNNRVGYIILEGLLDVDLSLYFRRLVVTEKRHGYGRAAIRLAQKIAFEQLLFHRLWLDVKDYNLAVKSLYETEGFTLDGILRECTKVDDHFESFVIMSILYAEYIKKS